MIETIEKDINESRRTSLTNNSSTQDDILESSLASSFKSQLVSKDGSFNMGITCNGSLIFESSLTSESTEIEFEDEWDTFDRETLLLASQNKSLENVKLDENIDLENLHYIAQRELESIDIKEVSIPKPKVKRWLQYVGYRLRLDEERTESSVRR